MSKLLTGKDGKEQEPCRFCGKTLREQYSQPCKEITCYR